MVFPSAFSPNAISHLQSVITNVIEENNIKSGQIFVDGSPIVAEADDPIETASIVADQFDLDKMGIADHTNNKFIDILGAIISVGKKLKTRGHIVVVGVHLVNTEDAGRTELCTNCMFDHRTNTSQC